MNLIKEWLNGIIIAAVTALAIFIFKNYLHPFILGILQRTPNLSGVWDSFDIENGEEIPKGRMEIRQIGNLVYATVHRKKHGGGERVFKYRGTISSGQVVFIWKEIKSNGYNMGTMALVLSGDLLKLKGMTTFHHHDQGKIISQEKIYKRINA
ncbi:MAG: hypothetical protein H7Y01_08345 [Ferruginibacter sp.]|nr:hypothetical protein [Chitinophagaceae bacterium]